MDLLAGLLSLRDLLDKEKLKQYADSLPTAEQNIDALKSGAMGLLSKAGEGANAVMGGLGRMADQATQQGAGIRDQLLQKYNEAMTPPPPPAQNPMGGYRGPYDAPAPEAPVYMAPDNSGEMWPREKIEAYYAMLQQQFGNAATPPKPAPTRAAFRKRQMGLLGGE